MAMGLSAQTDWDQLLQQTESLAAKDGQGFPRLERDIAQVEALSSRLKAKAHQSADTQAATRLLAQEGVNPRSLDRALQTVELKTSYEDVFQVESSSVDEYLQQVHEMTVVTAIQEAQQESVAAFNSFMSECMESDWAACKRQFFDASVPERALTNAAGPSSGQLALVAPGAGSMEASQEAQLSGREKGYVAAVRALNEANISRQPFNAVAAFIAATVTDVTDSRRSTVGMLWTLLGSMVKEVADMPSGSTSKTLATALMKGACKHLESGHVKHMQTTIQNNRSQANLGGMPSRKGQVCAFLRLKEKDVGPLDFDAPGGLDTTWHRVFFCLRSGFQAEALEEVQRAKDALMMHGQSFASHLRDWIGSDGRLAPEAALDLAEECERQKASADRHAWQRAGFRYKFAVHALLSGDRKAAETLLREGGSVFATIEDFMWFMAALFRSSPVSAPGSSLKGISGRCIDAYKLSDLQTYLNQFPVTHYSQEGKEPLLYATVLLLSLQLRALVTFLAKEPSARDYRVDAPHFAIALLHHKKERHRGSQPSLSEGSNEVWLPQVLGAGEEGDAGAKQGVNPGQVIHHYGLHFAPSAPDIALEYYMLAGQALGGDMQTKARLVRELLTESNAFGFLLGSGGGRGGALERWLGNQHQRQQLLEAVAADCQRAAQLDWACELYLCAGAPRPALHLLNLQISDLLEPTLSSPAQEEELESFLRRGAEAARMLAGSSSPADDVERYTLTQLRTAKDLLQAQRKGDNLRVVTLLPELGFLPTDNFRVQRCAEAVSALHPGLAQRIPTLLTATAKALAATGQVAQLRAIVAFAGYLPERISQGIFRELNEMYNQVA